MIECSHFLHRCRETVLCDGGGRWEPMRSVQVSSGAAPRSFVQHRARPEDPGLLVVLSPAPSFACRTCCRATEQRGSGNRLFDAQPGKHGIERGSDQPHSRFPLWSQGHGKNLPCVQRHSLGAGRIRNGDRRPAEAALTSSGKLRCFPIILVSPGACKEISDRPFQRLSTNDIADLRSQGLCSRRV